MKKIISLAVAVLLLASCSNLDEDSLSSFNQITKKTQEQQISLSEIKNSAWFSGDAEIQFPETDETLYIKYMPDSLSVTKWISLSENENGSVTAKIEWSEDVREIGKTSAVTITKSGKTLNVRCDFFSYEKMASYEGVTASDFDVSQVPALKAEYFSNFSGKYTLNTTKYELSIAAKLCISASVSSYWNANILNTVVLDDGTYDMLLAHSSAKDASGSIDPGITGNEPFVSRQGLFWSHLTLTPSEGSQWKVKWASKWNDTPYEALNETLNMEDTFTGPATTKIKYIYKFYFGEPKLKESGFGVEAENMSNIGAYSFESDLPSSLTWKQILEAASLSYVIPEDKLEDYWWYNNNGLHAQLESEVVKLSDSTEPSLKEYDFYLALKDKPEPATVYYQEGTFGREISGVLYSITVSATGIVYNGTAYTYLGNAAWGNNAKNGEPLRNVYLVSDGEKNYFCCIWWYTNNGSAYVHFNEPKETELTECFATSAEADAYVTALHDDGQSHYAAELYGTQRKTLNKVVE